MTSLERMSCLVRHTTRPVLAGTVPGLRALSWHPGQSTKMSRLGIQSDRIVPHSGVVRQIASWGHPIKCRTFHTSNLLTII